MSVDITIPVEVGAPVEAVWQKVTDWPGQGEWMLGTRVEVEGGGDGRHLGARLRAITGVGRVAVTDSMEIVAWEPPRRCVVRHTGKVVRGDGVFEVVALGPNRSRFLWSEQLELPLGAVGALGWRVVAPAFRWGIARSLRTMARRLEAERRG
jgi:Polyketide cyclase / dehydrase and lipid transport